MKSADANLILALAALLREGSVTGAARRTNVSAPAMSHTLARLRAAVGDPLFVRSGNRLVPTPRATAMHERVARAADEIGALLQPEAPLDVATLRRAFVIRMSDALVVTLGNPLEKIVRSEAPKVTLCFVGAPADGLEIDLDVGVQHGRSPDLHVQRLYRDEHVAVVRKDHPATRERFSRARLGELDCIAVASQPSKIETVKKAHARSHRRQPTCIVPSYLAAAALVRESDAYTLVPSRLASAILTTFGLRRLATMDAPSRIVVAQAWSARVDSDAAHGWLRGCIRRACPV